MSKLSEQATKALTSNVELKKLLEQKGKEIIETVIDNDKTVFYQFLSLDVWNGFKLSDNVLYIYKNEAWEPRTTMGRKIAVTSVDKEMDKNIQEIKRLNENIQQTEQEVKQLQKERKEHHEKGMHYLEQAWQNDQNILNDLRNKNPQSGWTQKTQNKNTGLQNFL